MLIIKSEFAKQPGSPFAICRAGRPPNYVPKIRNYLRFRSWGRSHRFACKAVGISISTPYSWKQKVYWYGKAKRRAMWAKGFAIDWTLASVLPSLGPLQRLRESGLSLVLGFGFEIIRDGIKCPFCRHTGPGIAPLASLARCEHEAHAITAARDVFGGDFGTILQPVLDTELLDEIVGVIAWHLRLPFPKRGGKGSILYREHWKAMLAQLKADKAAGRESIFMAPDFSEWPVKDDAQSGEAEAGDDDDEDFDYRELFEDDGDSEPIISIPANRLCPYQFRIVGEVS